MLYKLSRSVCLYAPDLENAIRHFEREIGLTLVNRTHDMADLSAADINLHIEKGPELGPIFQILAPDIEAAKVDLVSQGWNIEVWEGRNGRCHIRNPGGILFYVIEERSVFDSEEFEQDGSV